MIQEMENFIEIYDNAVPKKLCEYFINYFEESPRKYQGTTASGVNLQYKDSTDLLVRLYEPADEINSEEIVNVNRLINKKFLEYLEKYNYTLSVNDNRPNQAPLIDYYKPWSGTDDTMKMLILKKYNPPTQGYHGWHQDWGRVKESYSRRMLVAMTYLNDVEEGGETEWYHQKLKVKPKQGTMVVWPAYFTHMHKGHIPISNSKYIMNKWFYPGNG